MKYFGKYKIKYIIPILTIIFMVVLFVYYKEDIYAATEPFFLPTTSASTVTYSEVVNNGVRLYGNTYFMAVNNNVVKVGRSGSGIFGLGVPSTTPSNDNYCYAYTESNYVQYVKQKNFQNDPSYPTLKIKWYGLSGNANLNTSIPNFSDTKKILDYMEDTSWTLPTPDVFNDLNLGQLQEVTYRSSYNFDLQSMKYDVKCSNITSTNIDLTQQNYGVYMQWYLYENETDTIPSVVSNGISVLSQLLQSVGDTLLNMAYNLADASIGWMGGGGHSFTVPNNENAEQEQASIAGYQKADLALAPYYYDGHDYYIGYTTLIKGLRPGAVGTTLLTDGDTAINTNDVEIVYFDVVNPDEGEITEYNPSVVNYYNNYNYTYYGTDNNYIIPDSTNNLYPDAPIITFDWDPEDVNTSIKSFLSAIALFPPLIFQLFAYIPTWARDIAISVCVLIPVVGVIKLMNNRIPNQSGGDT